jgi:hypothetical protein
VWTHGFPTWSRELYKQLPVKPVARVTYLESYIIRVKEQIHNTNSNLLCTIEGGDTLV